MRDILQEIWATTRRNKLRTTLTGFAVAWGIFMLIFLLGAGNGLINATEQNSDRNIDNSMKVWGGTTSKPYKGFKEGREVQLKTADIATTERRFKENVDKVGASISRPAMQVVNGENYVSISITGTTPVEAEMSKEEMLYGRFINDIDEKHQRKVLVLNEKQAKELTTQTSALVGQHLKVNDFAFLVVGIVKSKENGRQPEGYMPLSTMRALYNKGDVVESITFSFHGLKTKEDNEAFEKNYKSVLNTAHDVAADDEDGLWIWNRFTQAMQMATGLGMMRTALWVIGIFTLLSGIVGVSNIMLITVKERTREFGIRKAIGAKPWSILRLILVESVIITTFFGYIGMVLGLAACEYMNATIGQEKVNTGLFEAAMFVNPTVGLSVCVQATLLMVVAGTLAGLIPARKASLVKPIEALNAK